MKRVPIPLMKWIDEHREALQPPVGNRCLYNEGDFIVMVVGGPNARADFHVNDTEELFYQLEGDISLYTLIDGQRTMTPIREGDLFLLPAGIPHLPIRPAKTVGLVVEMVRPKTSTDEFRWYCEQCQHLLHSEKLYVSDIETQLPEVFKRFYDDDAKRTCAQCGTHFVKPELT